LLEVKQKKPPQESKIACFPAGFLGFSPSVTDGLGQLGKERRIRVGFVYSAASTVIVSALANVLPLLSVT
jgi:hypothetical protein